MERRYRWELSADELNTVWWAVIERKDRLTKEREATKDLEVRQIKQDLANKCFEIQCQINRMRTRF